MIKIRRALLVHYGCSAILISVSLICKAREFLYFKLYGKQCITPVAIMTSSAKSNHDHITSLCERLSWFGRGRSTFQLFEQVVYKIILNFKYYFVQKELSYFEKLFLLVYFVHCQPLVPVVGAEDGQWLVTKPFRPLSKPGGHGVIWKLAYDRGIFKWFYLHGRKGATVRQVGSVIISDILILEQFFFFFQ